MYGYSTENSLHVLYLSVKMPAFYKIWKKDFLNNFLDVAFCSESITWTSLSLKRLFVIFKDKQDKNNSERKNKQTSTVRQSSSRDNVTKFFITIILYSLNLPLTPRSKSKHILLTAWILYRQYSNIDISLYVQYTSCTCPLLKPPEATKQNYSLTPRWLYFLQMQIFPR